MKVLMMGAICFVSIIGCTHLRDHGAKSPATTPPRTEPHLNENQRKVLDEWTHGIKTRNSVADIERLKDSLARWDELFTNPSPPEMKPVFAILKERVKERLAELEAEAARKPN